MSAPPTIRPAPGWLLARTFAPLFLGFSLLVVAAGAVHFYTRYQEERVTLESAEQAGVALARRALLADLASVVTDLMVLALQIGESLPDPETPLDTEALSRGFSIYAERKRLYDQIRFIDVAGRERVRVNFGQGSPIPVTGTLLQDKSGRYYFQEAMRLGPGAIYLSPLDLNVEQGAIEWPLKPMMRLATPVSDGAGHRRGILVLNYLGQRLLDNFAGAAAPVADHIHLVDNRGFWLSGPDPADAWGFMLGHERTFARRFPLEWQRIGEADEGRFFTPRGLFTFSTVSPREVAAAAAHSGFDVVGRPAGTGGPGAYAWKVIAHLPAERLAVTPAGFLQRHGSFYGVLLGLVALGTWLLARARVHHRLAEAQGEYERRFRRALEDIDLAAVTVDRAGRLTFCNRYFQLLTGWSGPEILGGDWVERFVPAEQQEAVRRTLGQLAEPRTFPRRYEAEIRTRVGARRLIAWHNTLSHETAGSALDVTAIGEDITERRRAELELLKLHRAVEQSPGIVVITDLAGRIEYVNPRFTEVTGYRPEEVIGENPRLLKSGEMSPDGYARLWRTISLGGVWHGEFHNRRKNGELYWESAAISAVRDAGGAITHYVAVKEDITGRKRLEQEVASRNRELARAQTLAEMGRMASMIAHDLRNPLSSVKVALQVLRRQTSEGAEAAEMSAIALEQVAYMEAIITDMLAYSRPQDPRLEWIAPVRLMETAIGLARRKIEEQGVRLHTDYQAGLPTLPGDLNQLRQVFSNLLVNAVQALEGRPAGEREIRIEVAVGLCPQGTAVHFRIADNGSGLPEKERERLFEPFFTTRAKGTGLGLAIVRRIVEQHRGEIRLEPREPREPRGTVATVILPTVPVDESAGTVVAQGSRSDSPGTP